jgi:hypothetical protein
VSDEVVAVVRASEVLPSVIFSASPAPSTRAADTRTPVAEVILTVVAADVETWKRTTFLVVLPVEKKSKVPEVIAVEARTTSLSGCEVVSDSPSPEEVEWLITTAVIEVALAGAAARPVSARAAAAAIAISFFDI